MLKTEKRKWLTLALCVSVVLLVLVILSFFIPLYGEICSQTQQANHEECPRYHAVPFALLWILGVIDEHNGFVTALATAFVAAFTWTLYRANIEQGRLSRESIDEFKKSSERQLRAYMFLSGIKGEIVVHDNRSTSVVKIEVKNSGQTPAYKLESWAALWVADFANAINFPAPPPGFQTVSAVLGPGAPYHLYVSVDITSDIGAIESSKKAIFAYGGMRYRDAFDRPRTTTFRMRCSGERGLKTGFFDYCLLGNEAD